MGLTAKWEFIFMFTHFYKGVSADNEYKLVGICVRFKANIFADIDAHQS